MIARLLPALVLVLATPLASATPDVAAIDRERILQAADVALALEPVAITQPVLWLEQ